MTLPVVPSPLFWAKLSWSPGRFWNICCLKSEKSSLEGRLPEKGRSAASEPSQASQSPASSTLSTPLHWLCEPRSRILNNFHPRSPYQEKSGVEPKEGAEVPLQGKKMGESGSASYSVVWRDNTRWTSWKNGPSIPPALSLCPHRAVAPSSNNC